MRRLAQGWAWGLAFAGVLLLAAAAVAAWETEAGARWVEAGQPVSDVEDGGFDVLADGEESAVAATEFPSVFLESSILGFKPAPPKARPPPPPRRPPPPPRRAPPPPRRASPPPRHAAPPKRAAPKRPAPRPPKKQPKAKNHTAKPNKSKSKAQHKAAKAKKPKSTKSKDKKSKDKKSKDKKSKAKSKEKKSKAKKPKVVKKPAAKKPKAKKLTDKQKKAQKNADARSVFAAMSANCKAGDSACASRKAAATARWASIQATAKGCKKGDSVCHSKQGYAKDMQKMIKGFEHQKAVAFQNSDASKTWALRNGNCKAKDAACAKNKKWASDRYDQLAKQAKMKCKNSDSACKNSRGYAQGFMKLMNKKDGDHFKQMGKQERSAIQANCKNSDLGCQLRKRAAQIRLVNAKATLKLNCGKSDTACRNKQSWAKQFVKSVEPPCSGFFCFVSSAFSSITNVVATVGKNIGQGVADVGEGVADVGKMAYHAGTMVVHQVGNAAKMAWTAAKGGFTVLDDAAHGHFSKMLSDAGNTMKSELHQGLHALSQTGNDLYNVAKDANGVLQHAASAINHVNTAVTAPAFAVTKALHVGFVNKYISGALNAAEGVATGGVTTEIQGAAQASAGVMTIATMAKTGHFNLGQALGAASQIGMGAMSVAGAGGAAGAADSAVGESAVESAAPSLVSQMKSAAVSSVTDQAKSDASNWVSSHTPLPGGVATAVMSGVKLKSSRNAPGASLSTMAKNAAKDTFNNEKQIVKSNAKDWAKQTAKTYAVGQAKQYGSAVASDVLGSFTSFVEVGSGEFDECPWDGPNSLAFIEQAHYASDAVVDETRQEATADLLPLIQRALQDSSVRPALARYLTEVAHKSLGPQLNAALSRLGVPPTPHGPTEILTTHVVLAHPPLSPAELQQYHQALQLPDIHTAFKFAMGVHLHTGLMKTVLAATDSLHRGDHADTSEQVVTDLQAHIGLIRTKAAAHGMLLPADEDILAPILNAPVQTQSVPNPNPNAVGANPSAASTAAASVHAPSDSAPLGRGPNGRRLIVVEPDPNSGGQLPGDRERNEASIKKVAFELRWARSIKQKHLHESQGAVTQADRTNQQFRSLQRASTRQPLIRRDLMGA